MFMSNRFVCNKTGWFGRNKEIHTSCTVSICVYMANYIKYVLNLRYYIAAISNYSTLVCYSLNVSYQCSVWGWILLFKNLFQSGVCLLNTENLTALASVKC